MSPEVISLIGIILGMVIVVYGSMKSLSLIILSSIAAVIVSLTGGVGFVNGYTSYLQGVGNSIVSMYPLFLGGQLLGCFLEKSQVTESIANAVIRKFGTKAIVLAVYTVSWILVFCGVNTFVIIFTVYPLAAAFFKVGDIPRDLIPACVLGAAVSVNVLPGIANNQNGLCGPAFGIPAMSAPITGIVLSIGLFIANSTYLIRQGKKAQAEGRHFVPIEGENLEVDLNKKGLPNPFLAIIPLGTVLVTLNVVKLPAYAALYCGAIVAMVIFWVRNGGLQGAIATLNKAAKGSSNVITTCAIVGFCNIVAAVPGYQLILSGLEGLSGGNPYIFACIAVAVIAGVSGSAAGGMKFVLNSFAEKMVAMGGDPGSLTRVIAASSLTFDSLPHNSAIVLTLNACHVTHKEGYKHLAVTTVLNTVIAAIVAVIFGSIGIR